MAAPWAVDMLVSTTSTLTTLAVISFDKMTDRKFNAVGGKGEKSYDAAQVGEQDNETQIESAEEPPQCTEKKKRNKMKTKTNLHTEEKLHGSKIKTEISGWKSPSIRKDRHQ